MKEYNVLFICKHNVFRSQVAEAYFNQINHNPHIKARSGGIFRHHTLMEKQIEEARKLGVYMKGKSKSITTDILSNQDLIVIVADDVPKDIIAPRIYGGEILYWDTYDPGGENPDESRYEETIENIKIKVKDLVNKLKQK